MPIDDATEDFSRMLLDHMIDLRRSLAVLASLNHRSKSKHRWQHTPSTARCVQERSCLASIFLVSKSIWLR